MFRSFVYLNDEKFYSYKCIVDGKVPVTRTNYSTSGRVGTNFSLGTLSLDAAKEKSEEGEYRHSVEYDYNDFEHRLESLEGTTFFDFILHNDEYAFSTLPQMCLIKLNGYIDIPESFDMLTMVSQYKDIIFSVASMPKDKEEAARLILENSSADIPITIDCEDCIISSKLNVQYLLQNYTDLERFSEIPATILCKVEGYIDKQSVVIYNPTRDFVRLNRSIRRASRLEENEALRPISVEGPVLKVEIVAIYC